MSRFKELEAVSVKIPPVALNAMVVRAGYAAWPEVVRDVRTWPLHDYCGKS
jgi:hypothetical protein